MRAALLLAALAAGGPAELIERGGLELRLPVGWGESAPPRTVHGAVTVTLGPREGAGFELLLSVLPARPGGVDTRALVEQQGRRLLSSSVERSLAVQELRGAHGAGHYFALRDRAPGPGEFEYILQGLAVYGRREVSFTLLTRTADGPERPALLELLRGARPRD